MQKQIVALIVVFIFSVCAAILVVALIGSDATYGETARSFLFLVVSVMLVLLGWIWLLTSSDNGHELEQAYKQSTLLGVIGSILAICGIAAIAFQAGRYLYEGSWTSVSLITFLESLNLQWATEPGSWTGLWRTLNLVPYILVPGIASLICFLDATKVKARKDEFLMRKKYEKEPRVTINGKTYELAELDDECRSRFHKIKSSEEEQAVLTQQKDITEKAIKNHVKAFEDTVSAKEKYLMRKKYEKEAKVTINGTTYELAKLDDDCRSRLHKIKSSEEELINLSQQTATTEAALENRVKAFEETVSKKATEKATQKANK